MFLGGLGFLSLAVLSHPSSQTVLGSEQPHPQSTFGAPYDDESFTPVKYLSALLTSSFTTLVHPYFPNHSISIKKTYICDVINAYTGYIDIQDRHLFFYFFGSHQHTDDIIFWTNGGPGCSSSLGLFMGLGPCSVLDHGPTYNPFSWTTNINANIFFVDQPIDVGFSYAEYSETESTAEEVAKDIAAFVAIFFENFGEFKGRAFHMAGESYGGRYIPVFASEVYDQNARLVEAGLTPINLQSVMIVYGCLGVPSCERQLPRCQKWIIESCIDQFDALSCGAASDFCDNEIFAPHLDTGLDPYDMSKACKGDPDSHCYPVTKHVTSYLDLAATRTLLGVDPSVTSNFSSCNDGVFSAFTNAQDGVHETYTYISALLERSVALIYVGTYNWICSWIDNERWTLGMPWTGQEAFVSQPLRPWQVDGHVVGKTRGANGLTFATVDGAGHMVPFDKPREALALVQRWLAKKEL